MQKLKFFLGTLVMVTFFLMGLLRSMEVTQAQSVPSNHTIEAQATDPLLAIYILAFDNNPDEPLSLSTYYTPTVQSIVDGTKEHPTKTAVMLIDLDGGLDTHILIAQEGTVAEIDGLPEIAQDGSIQLNETIQELDMADGQALGAFLLWAKAQVEGGVTILSFLGHGESVVPKVNFMPPDSNAAPDLNPPASGELDSENDADRGEEPIAPLPARWRAHQGFTDYRSASLLSIYDLGLALSIATNNGAEPFRTVDLVQCFSSSIEELYELHPYAETILGAPNYTYSKPDMVGKALDAVDPSMTASEMATTILSTYDNELPIEGHPRLLVGVESNKIPAIKEAWDQTSLHLVQALEDEMALDDTKIRIQTAYTQSAKYDTTLCNEADFALAPPDAMSDMSDFATQLSSTFGQTSPVGSWALTTTAKIDAAIIVRHDRGGVPWFAEGENLPEWSLHGPGISLFTDFSADSVENLSWQAYWYSDTISTQVPHPFQFLQNAESGASWADVFALYWGYDALSESAPDFNSTQYKTLSECEPAFLSGRGQGELNTSNLIVSTSSGQVSAATSLKLTSGLTFTLAVDVGSEFDATNPQVRFVIYRNGRRIMAEVETPGFLPAGSVRQVQLSRNWEAEHPGLYEFEVIVDADERFTETNEEDNIVRSTLSVIAPAIHLPYFVR
ncbi:MAG: CARDB domain-containing protein [Chloroflexota bacterium]